MKYLISVVTALLLVGSLHCQKLNQIEEDTIADVYEKPLFYGCGDVESVNESQGCSNEAMWNYLDKMKSPSKLYFDSIVKIRFVIDESGIVTDVEVMKSCGDERCDRAAIVYVERMPTWSPAWKNGEPVKYRMTVHARFDTIIADSVEASTVIEEVSEEEIFMIVEEMPLFNGCGDNGNESEAQQCSQRAIFEYLIEISYPALAVENGIEGKAYVGFVVDTNGDVINVKLLRSAGHDLLDNAALSHISNMPKWTPAKQRGKPVKIQMTIPVSFKLTK